LIARRPASADDVAAWARIVHHRSLDGLNGLHGQERQAQAVELSIESTSSTGRAYAEISANGMLALIAVASSLLDRQMASLEKTFLEQGGFTERLYRLRNERRNRR
jgi:four helix bundle suffix protein